MGTLIGSLVTLVIFLSLSTAYCRVVGVNGATYPIVEPDAYEEIIDRVRKVDWVSVIEQAKTKARGQQVVSFKLKKATSDHTFHVDPTYELEFDIIDEKGQIIYPKGYRFNPLDYMPFPYKLVFFNANSPVEMEWLKTHKDILNQWDYILVATAGDVLKAQNEVKKTVYAASKKMIDRFNIKATPSVVYANGRVIEVKEVGVYGVKAEVNKSDRSRTSSSHRK